LQRGLNRNVPCGPAPQIAKINLNSEKAQGSQSLRRLQTDHLDLWQIHGVSFDNDPDLFIRRPSGNAELLLAEYRRRKYRQWIWRGVPGSFHPQGGRNEIRMDRNSPAAMGLIRILQQGLE